MSDRCWDELLDLIEHTVLQVEEALASGEDMPELAPFVPPADVMPAMTDAQRDRAARIMRRQSRLERAVAAEIMTTVRDVGETRRRRRAVSAYAGRG